MKREWYADFLRSIFFFIDRAVYWLVEISYELFHNLAGIGLLDNSTFERFTSRIYLLLGIFALFKISFALIGMFVNPDTFTDPKAGGGKLIKKVFTVLILIVFVPSIFRIGFQLQSILLNNNIIGTIILGNTNNVEQTTTTFEKGGRIISTTIFKAFFRPALKTTDGKIDYANCAKCKELYEDKPVSDVTVGEFHEVISKVDSNKMYIFDYNIFISLVAGLGAAYLLIMFAFDVAIRSVKLTFLQLIAPIPIIMSLDPKKGEEGLKKWISTTVGTYVDLFMRLAIIYFIIFIIAEITKNGGNSLTLFSYDASGNAVEVNEFMPFTIVFIIFGLLLFAKEAPNLIYDLMGMKPPSGGFGLNPIKRLSSIPLLGGHLGAGASYLGNTLKNAAKLGGSALIGGAWKTLGKDDKAKKTLDNAKNKFANRSAIAKQEAYERYASNKWGGNEKYSGTTVSGQEQKNKTEAFQKKQEAEIDSNNKKRLHDIGKGITSKKISFKKADGSVGEVEYDDIKRLTNSTDMTAAYKEVFGKDEFASSMTNVNYGKIQARTANRDLQIAIAKVNQNPGDEKAIEEYEKAAGAVKKAEGILKGYEDNHQKIRARYKEQAEIEDAIKISEGPNVGQTQTFTEKDINPKKANEEAESNRKSAAFSSMADQDALDAYEAAMKKQSSSNSNTSQDDSNSGSSRQTRTPEQKPKGGGSSRPQY
jgi:hypothetical protein